MVLYQTPAQSCLQLGPLIEELVPRMHSPQASTWLIGVGWDMYGNLVFNEAFCHSVDFKLPGISPGDSGDLVGGGVAFNAERARVGNASIVAVIVMPRLVFRAGKDICGQDGRIRVLVGDHDEDLLGVLSGGEVDVEVASVGNIQDLQEGLQAWFDVSASEMNHGLHPFTESCGSIIASQLMKKIEKKVTTCLG